jgi:hypothetical protein
MGTVLVMQVTTSSHLPVIQRADPPATAKEIPASNLISPADFSAISPSEKLLGQINAEIQFGDPMNKERLRVLIAKLVRDTPEAAGQFAESLETGEIREEVLHLVAQFRAGQDEASAEKWAAQLPNESERISALSDICLQTAETDPRSALEIAGHNDLKEMSAALTAGIVQKWAKQDFSDASNWVKDRPPGEGRDQMLQRLALVESETDPAAAASLVAEQISPGPVQNEAVISIVHQWAMQDMNGASEWVALFPHSAIRDRAEEELTGIAEHSRQKQPETGPMQ